MQGRGTDVRVHNELGNGRNILPGSVALNYLRGDLAMTLLEVLDNSPIASAITISVIAITCGYVIDQFLHYLAVYLRGWPCGRLEDEDIEE